LSGGEAIASFTVMLPEGLSRWLGDLSSVLGILTVVIAVLGWLVSRLAPASPPRRERPQSGARIDASLPCPAARERSTVGGSIRTALLHLIIRPEVPIGQDISRLAGGIVGLVVAAGLWAWNVADPQTSTVPIVVILQTMGLYAMLGLALLLVLQAARLFWKIGYLRGERDGGIPSPPGAVRPAAVRTTIMRPLGWKMVWPFEPPPSRSASSPESTSVIRAGTSRQTPNSPPRPPRRSPLPRPPKGQAVAARAFSAAQRRTSSMPFFLRTAPASEPLRNLIRSAPAAGSLAFASRPAARTIW
jgi:hypothetical protein